MFFYLISKSGRKYAIILGNMEEKRNLKGDERKRTLRMIAGIGNPSEEYRLTYHNAGLLFLSFLEKKISTENRLRPHSSDVFAYVKKEGFPVLVSSLLFMNESGMAVGRASRFFRVPPEALLVAHDDADLPLGEYQLAFDKGAAGHNGVRSIIEELGTQSFWRLRFGIRKETTEKAGRKKAETFVLKKINKEDISILVDTFRTAVKHESLFEPFRINGETRGE